MLWFAVPTTRGTVFKGCSIRTGVDIAALSPASAVCGSSIRLQESTVNYFSRFCHQMSDKKEERRRFGRAYSLRGHLPPGRGGLASGA